MQERRKNTNVMSQNDLQPSTTNVENEKMDVNGSDMSQMAHLESA